MQIPKGNPSVVTINGVFNDGTVHELAYTVAEYNRMVETKRGGTAVLPNIPSHLPTKLTANNKTLGKTKKNKAVIRR